MTKKSELWVLDICNPLLNFFKDLKVNSNRVLYSVFDTIIDIGESKSDFTILAQYPVAHHDRCQIFPFIDRLFCSSEGDHNYSVNNESRTYCWFDWLSLYIHRHQPFHCRGMLRLIVYCDTLSNNGKKQSILITWFNLKTNFHDFFWTVWDSFQFWQFEGQLFVVLRWTKNYEYG